jgi:predicted nucleic acid-binding protein
VIVLDASALIAHLDEHDAHHAVATARLLELADEPFAAGTVTLAEVLVGPTRSGRLAEVEAALGALDVAELPLPPDSARKLAALRVETALKLPDCCVLLAAASVGGRVVTFDERLSREAARRGLAA